MSLPRGLWQIDDDLPSRPCFLCKAPCRWVDGDIGFLHPECHMWIIRILDEQAVDRLLNEIETSK